MPWYVKPREVRWRGSRALRPSKMRGGVHEAQDVGVVEGEEVIPFCEEQECIALLCGAVGVIAVGEEVGDGEEVFCIVKCDGVEEFEVVAACE